ASLAETLMPASDHAEAYFAIEGGAIVPSRILRFGDDVARLRELPVFGVELGGATAYAAWRSSKTGRAYRLPHEWEWEKAARGADARIYPWGNRFDATRCKMRESRREPPRPEPRGAFASDASIYGVRDLAGGVAAWVLPAPCSAALH